MRLQTQGVDAAGTGHLERVTLATAGSATQHTVPAAALFVLIGSEPQTEWLAGALERDRNGYVRTGADLTHQGAVDAPARAPLSHEASLPGVFAAGDVRAGSPNRMATAVGDGSIAIRLVHEYLSRR